MVFEVSKRGPLYWSMKNMIGPSSWRREARGHSMSSLTSRNISVNYEKPIYRKLQGKLKKGTYSIKVCK